MKSREEIEERIKDCRENQGGVIGENQALILEWVLELED